MSRTSISFGTAGWRGVISDEFTFDNLRLVVQAISDMITPEEAERGIVIGYDTRFLGAEFGRAAAEVLAANSIKVIYSPQDTPTPVISYYIIKKKLAGGINITASHNPPEYSGIKFSPSWGGPALPETTSRIEDNALKIQEGEGEVKRIDFNEGVERKLIRVENIYEEYLKSLREKIDIELVNSISLGFDCMYGTAREYIPRLLDMSRVSMIKGYRDVLFGGHRPEPAGELLDDLREIVKRNSLEIGLATDGDADRFGIVDSDGSFISPNEVLGLALYHLYNRGFRGVAVRSVMTSSFIDGVAELLGVELVETPVGFKYIGDVFVNRDIIVGGEESGGLTIGGHIPEKDGILACLLMAELRATEGRPLKEILEELQEKTGRYITSRKNYTLSSKKMQDVRDSIQERLPTSFGKFSVTDVIRKDGYKFMLDSKNAWVGFRFSGTEPVVRIYAEASSQEVVDEIILAAGESFGI